MRLEKTFYAEYTRRLSEDGLSTKQATELSQQFQNVVKAMHLKLKRYMDGEQPAMEFFSAVLCLLDPTQHAMLNTNFAMLKLPFVKPQVQQEWQQFINISSDPASISNPDLVLYWCSLLSTLPTLASMALSSLAVPPASVEM